MRFGRLSSRWSARLVAFAVWALAAGSGVFWGLQLSAGGLPAQRLADAGLPQAGLSVDSSLVAQALGAAGADALQVETALEGRVQLLGVVTHGSNGAALIAVDGGPARPVRVGHTPPGLDSDWTLHSVTSHAAVLAAGERQFQLEMPPMDQRSRAGDAVAASSDADASDIEARQSVAARVGGSVVHPRALLAPSPR